MTASSSFALAPTGQTFPRFAFLRITEDIVNVTHHWMDGNILRKRTDSLQQETAAQLIYTLTDQGFTYTENLSQG